MLWYLSLDIIWSSKLFSEQTMSAKKYPSIFSRQMEATVYVFNKICYLTGGKRAPCPVSWIKTDWIPEASKINSLGKRHLNFRFARDQVVYLETAGNLSASRRQANNFFPVFSTLPVIWSWCCKVEKRDDESPGVIWWKRNVQPLRLTVWENTSLLLKWEGPARGGENWDSLMTSFIIVESRAMVVLLSLQFKTIQCSLTNTTIAFAQSDSLRTKVVVSFNFTLCLTQNFQYLPWHWNVGFCYTTIEFVQSDSTN